MDDEAKRKFALFSRGFLDIPLSGKNFGKPKNTITIISKEPTMNLPKTKLTNEELRDKILKDYLITTVTHSFVIDKPPKVIEFKNIVNIPIDDLMNLIQSHTSKAISDVLDRLNTNFITNLTIDSETTDARRKDFNQAIFDVEEGYQIFNGTDLGMVLDKFNKAIQQERNKLKEVSNE